MSPRETPTAALPPPFLLDPPTIQEAGGCSESAPARPPALVEGDADTKSIIRLAELEGLPRQLSTSKAQQQQQQKCSSSSSSSSSNVSSPAQDAAAAAAATQRTECLRSLYKGALRASAAMAEVQARTATQPACLPLLPSLRVLRKKEQQQQQQPAVAVEAHAARSSYHHVKLDLERIRPYLEKHGTHGMAYGHLHKAQYHFEVPGLGLVSYCWVRSFLGRAAFVTTDPLAAPGADTLELLTRFHATVPGMKQYCGVSQPTADALRALGYRATVFGNNYTGDYTAWQAPKGRRRYLNEGTHAGLVVEELRYDELTAAGHARVAEISARWLGNKAGFGAELQMLTYPFYEHDEWQVRKFYCFDKPRDQGGQMLAYIFFTPCFRDGKVVGHTANILRRDPTLNKKLSYVLDFLLLHCDRRFRAEGAEFLSLSFSPLHGLEPAEKDSPFLRRVFRQWYAMPSRLYRKKTLGRHKDHFKMNRVEKVYACAKGTRAHVAILDLILTCTNLLPVAKRRHGIES